MLDYKTTLGTLLLTVAVSGCNPPARSTSATGGSNAGTQQQAASDTWVTSKDGNLALRFSVLSRTVRANESIHVVAEIRNNSKQDITVLRPFGDDYSARASGMRIWDGQRQISYTGAIKAYVIGASGFAIVTPAATVEDKLELTIDNFAAMKAPGAYTLRYDYSYNGEWDATAAAGKSGIKDAWRGWISSREVQVVRK